MKLRIFPLLLLASCATNYAFVKGGFTSPQIIDGKEVIFFADIQEHVNVNYFIDIRINASHLLSPELENKITKENFLTAGRNIAAQFCKKPAKELNITYSFSNCSHADILGIPCVIGDMATYSSKKIPELAKYEFTCG